MDHSARCYHQKCGAAKIHRPKIHRHVSVIVVPMVPISSKCTALVSLFRCGSFLFCWFRNRSNHHCVWRILVIIIAVEESLGSIAVSFSAVVAITPKKYDFAFFGMAGDSLCCSCVIWPRLLSCFQRWINCCCDGMRTACDGFDMATIACSDWLLVVTMDCDGLDCVVATIDWHERTRATEDRSPHEWVKCKM